MPFTPFHMGPGLAVKAVAGRRFSVVTFGVAQVAMDLETLVRMLRGSAVLHGPVHTYLGAVLMAIPVTLISPLLGRPILRRWNRALTSGGLAWLASPDAFAPRTVALSALLGTVSHVALDSLMHADITPLAPWSDANVLLGLISAAALYRWCVLAGVLGVVGWLAGSWLQRGASPD